jgi:hypothetical protein
MDYINGIGIRDIINKLGVLLAVAAIVLTTHGVSAANPKSLSGVVQTGGTSSSQPLPNVNVT